jgi:hypothetical protein
MAKNENGNDLDSSGQVAIDFVWGNFPIQPNDERAENGGGLLSAALDNHNIAYQGYNGYPQYIPNTHGLEGAGYISVPNALGLATAAASRILTDDGLVVTVATAATNTATQPTRINVTSTTAATVTVAGGTNTWPVGTKVTIATGTGIPAAVVGTWTVTTGGSGTTLAIAGTGWTVADSGAITPGTKLTGAAGTIKSQSVAANADNIAVGTAITITPWA